MNMMKNSDADRKVEADAYAVSADELRQFIEQSEFEAVVEMYKAALGM